MQPNFDQCLQYCVIYVQSKHSWSSGSSEPHPVDYMFFYNFIKPGKHYFILKIFRLGLELVLTL